MTNYSLLWTWNSKNDTSDKSEASCKHTPFKEWKNLIFKTTNKPYQ